jgi:mono/diheme cytochrome c family protein
MITAMMAAVAAASQDILNDFLEVDPNIHLEAPAPSRALGDADQVERGRYMTQLLGCVVCHTDGALFGEADMSRRLAGSRIGIAYSNPLVEENPGILYPKNLTPDPDTGIGKWRDDALVDFIRTGIDPSGRSHLPVMPWPSYARLTDEDAEAIVAYLKSLAPIRFKVPENVEPGQPAEAPYVHFGVYRSRRTLPAFVKPTALME